MRDAAVNQPEQLLRQVPGVEVRNYSLGGVVNVITESRLLIFALDPFWSTP